MAEIVSSERWKEAQSSEKEFWDLFGTAEIRKNHEDAYIKKINHFSKIWGKIIKLDKDTKVLQIGCGPLDIINYIKFGKRYSVDPLANFYRTKFKFDYDSANLVQAGGEELPYKDNTFDLVILANVLDHVNNPEKVLSEAKRVLKKEGVMHFECAYYQRSFLVISKFYGFFKKIFTKETFNVHHPYMFSLKKLKKLLKKYFKVQRGKIGENFGSEVHNLKDVKKLRMKQKLTRKIPALFGILGNITYSAICYKN